MIVYNMVKTSLNKVLKIYNDNNKGAFYEKNLQN